MTYLFDDDDKSHLPTCLCQDCRIGRGEDPPPLIPPELKSYERYIDEDRRIGEDTWESHYFGLARIEREMDDTT